MKKSRERKKPGEQHPKNMNLSSYPNLTVQNLTQYPRSKQQYLSNISQSAGDAYRRGCEEERRSSNDKLEMQERRIKRQALTKVSELINWFLKDEHKDSQGQASIRASDLLR